MRKFFSKYYRPGLISLIFLPLFIYPLFKHEHEKRDLRVIGFAVPFLNIATPLTDWFPTRWTYENMRTMLDTSALMATYQVKPGKLSKFEFAFERFAANCLNQDSLKSLYQNKTYYIKFKFDKTLLYNDLVEHLDLLIKHNTPNYFVDWDNLEFNIIYHYKAKPTNESELSDFFTCGQFDIPKKELQKTYFTILKENYKLDNGLSQLMLGLFFSFLIASVYPYFKT